MIPSDIVNLTYLVLPLLADPTVILCIDLVLPMGWVKLPDFFCSESKTVADNANGYALDPSSAFSVYPHHGQGIQE